MSLRITAPGSGSGGGLHRPRARPL